MEQKKKQKRKGSSTKIIAPKNNKTEHLSKDEVRSINKQKLKRRRKIKRIISLLCLAISIVCVSAVLVLTVFFKINTIKISGASVYANKKIIEQSNITIGSSLFSVNEEELNELLTKRLPYIKEIKLKRKLPDTISIEVVETTEVAAFSNGSAYVLIDETGKVLSKSATEIKDGVTLVKGLSFKTAEEGKVITFNDEKLTADFLELLGSIKENELQLITEISLTKDKEFKAVYDGRIIIKFGLMDDIDKKIQRAKIAIDQENSINPYCEGVLDLGAGTNYYFKPGPEEELTISPVFVTDENGNVVTDAEGEFVTHPPLTSDEDGNKDEEDGE